MLLRGTQCSPRPWITLKGCLRGRAAYRFQTLSKCTHWKWSPLWLLCPSSWFCGWSHQLIVLFLWFWFGFHLGLGLGFGVLGLGFGFWIVLLGFYVLFHFVLFLTRNKGQHSLSFSPWFPIPNDSQCSKTVQMKQNSNKVGSDKNMCLRVNGTSRLEVAEVAFAQRAIVSMWKLWMPDTWVGIGICTLTSWEVKPFAPEDQTHDGTNSGSVCYQRHPWSVLASWPHLRGTAVMLGTISSNWQLSSGRYYWCPSEEQGIFRNSEIKHLVDFFSFPDIEDLTLHHHTKQNSKAPSFKKSIPSLVGKISPNLPNLPPDSQGRTLLYQPTNC